MSMATLLSVDDTATALAECFTRPPLANERWIVEHTNWSSFRFESCIERPADLIVAAAAPTQSRVSDFFTWLRDHPVGSATIAVLPEDPDAGLLHDCFLAVDDFVLCPLRPEELRHRIARIIRPDGGESVPLRARLN